MRVVATADFHGSLPPEGSVPECELLIIAGDFDSNSALELGTLGFWIADQPAQHVVSVGGNVDWIVDRNEARALIEEVMPWKYLSDNSVEVEGKLVYGSSWKRTDDPHNWDEIPNETEILVTHQPPYGILDRAWGDQHVGSKELRKVLDSGRLSNLKLHVFGHIHEQAGKFMQVDGTTFANVGYLGTYPPMKFDV